MDKKENTGTKLNVLLCNLVDYVRGDDRPLVFAVMQGLAQIEECGKIFFISWRDNGCQCSGCVEEKCWECMEKLGHKDGRY